MVAVRKLPYGPAASDAVSEAGQMAASDYVPTLPKTACALWGVHRWFADCRLLANRQAFQTLVCGPGLVPPDQCQSPAPFWKSPGQYWFGSTKLGTPPAAFSLKRQCVVRPRISGQLSTALAILSIYWFDFSPGRYAKKPFSHKFLAVPPVPVYLDGAIRCRVSDALACIGASVHWRG